jgi:hypothetical protein
MRGSIRFDVASRYLETLTFDIEHTSLTDSPGLLCFCFLADLLAACKAYRRLPLRRRNTDVYQYSQITNNLTNQAATMKLGGTPNDIVQNLDPITLIIVIPIMDQLVYPYIAKKGWNFTPIKKVCISFASGAIRSNQSR